MKLGTPLSPAALRVMLLGAGELGKEVVIELQRLGVETIAVDRYADAPAMQVAHRSHVLDMTDAAALRALVERERPHLLVPEIEALATDEQLNSNYAPRAHNYLQGGSRFSNAIRNASLGEALGESARAGIAAAEEAVAGFELQSSARRAINNYS